MTTIKFNSMEEVNAKAMEILQQLMEKDLHQMGELLQRDSKRMIAVINKESLKDYNLWKALSIKANMEAEFFNLEEFKVYRPAMLDILNDDAIMMPYYESEVKCITPEQLDALKNTLEEFSSLEL